MMEKTPVAMFSDWIKDQIELSELTGPPMHLRYSDVTDMRDELLYFEKSMAVSFAYEVLSKLGNIKDVDPLEVGPLRIIEMYDSFFKQP